MTTPKPLTRRRPSPTGKIPTSVPAVAGDPTAVACAPPTVVVIAIAGGSGAGKTWLARTLARRLGRHAGVIALDDFYRDLAGLPPSRRSRMNFDSPEAIDWELFDACLDRIRDGRPVAVPSYDFSTHTRRPKPRRWTNRRIVLVEGLWPWSRRAQERHFALRLFREGPEAVRLARRLHRDVTERARTAASVRHQWRETVQPMHENHVQPQARDADVLLGFEIPSADLAGLVQLIRRLAGLENP